MRDKLTKMPSFAWVAVTNKCNLSCGHCQRRLLKKQGLIIPKEMSARVFEKLEQELIPSLKKIQFGGNNFGEQLSASNWDDIFARVSKFNIDISLVSNAILLTTERMNVMIDAGVEFNFSLEGITSETYESVRGCNFENFITTVTEACRKKAGTRSRVNLGFTALRDNVTEIPKLLSIAAGLGVDRVTITHFVPWEEGQRQNSLVYHKALTNQILGKARELARDYKLLVDLPLLFTTDESPKNKDLSGDIAPMSLAPCYHPWESVSISEKGNVMPCCASSVVMGSLEDSSFSEIWNNRKYQKLRKTVNSSRPLSFCRNCGLRGLEVGDMKPLSFCSDEGILLGAIGKSDHARSSRYTLRTVKNSLLKTGLGSKLVPYAMEIYRKHVAFYAIAILDGRKPALSKKDLRSKSQKKHHEK